MACLNKFAIIIFSLGASLASAHTVVEPVLEVEETTTEIAASETAQYRIFYAKVLAGVGAALFGAALMNTLFAADRFAGARDYDLLTGRPIGQDHDLLR